MLLRHVTHVCRSMTSRRWLSHCVLVTTSHSMLLVLHRLLQTTTETYIGHIVRDDNIMSAIGMHISTPEILNNPQTLNNLYTVCCICLKSCPAPSLESPNEQVNLARSASQGLQPDTRDYAQQAHAPIQRNTDLCLQVRAQLRQAHRHPSSWQSLASRSSPTVLPSSSTADACGSPVTQCSTEMSNLPNCTLSETMQYTLECMGNN